MQGPERIEYVGRSRPGPGCRIVGIGTSKAYAGRHGLVMARRSFNIWKDLKDEDYFGGFVIVEWDDTPYAPEVVNILLIEDEPILDQLSRIKD